MLLGVDVPAAMSDSDPRAAAALAEGLGFDFISTNDHVLGKQPRYEGWTFLTWLAASSNRIRVATRVLGVPYREPALVAKMAESLARLSGGRLILGLGAGSGEAEYAQMGLPPQTVSERVSALEEAVDVIHGVWAGPNFSYDGSRYRTASATIEPRPDQAIPIWLGTVGPRGLDLLGRKADGWIPSPAYAPVDKAPAMIERIRQSAVAAGRDPDRIERIYNIQVAFEPGADADVAGTPAEVAGRLRDLVDIGFTGFNFLLADRDRDRAARILAGEVLPALRG
jgi:alkanesulfonate monooxygenase SsuD/methylene tetrahydromethanopterin reductase-like flavin-dependent oxidoreductase (luciferase family)